MAVYAYVRVSTDRQADEGESLGVQERTIAGYAIMHGMTINRTFVERSVSGAKPIGQRPEGAKLLEVLRHGDVVIAAKLDRLFRSALDALEVHAQFIKRGIGLAISAGTSPTACRSCSIPLPLPSLRLSATVSANEF